MKRCQNTSLKYHNERSLNRQFLLLILVLQHSKPIVRLFIKAPKLVHMLTNVFWTILYMEPLEILPLSALAAILENGRHSTLTTWDICHCYYYQLALPSSGQEYPSQPTFSSVLVRHYMYSLYIFCQCKSDFYFKKC